VRSFNWCLRTKKQIICQTTEHCIITYLPFISIKVKVHTDTQALMPVFANTFLFSFKQAHICNYLVILFLRAAVRWPHAEKKPFQRRPDLQAQQECIERWRTCSLFQKFIVSEASEIASWFSTSNMHVLWHLTAIGTGGAASSRVHVLWHLMGQEFEPLHWRW